MLFQIFLAMLQNQFSNGINTPFIRFPCKSRQFLQVSDHTRGKGILIQELLQPNQGHQSIIQ